MPKIFTQRRLKLEARHGAFAFQAEAFNALKTLEYGAIFHEQGLGKTKIAIDIILYWLGEKIVDTVLLIVKKSLIANWQRELAIHTRLRARELTQNRTTNFYVFNTPSPLILTNYEVCSSELGRLKLFLKARDVAAILDESTKIKNPTSKLTKAFFDLAPLFKRRIIMSGTPVANRPEDLWSQVYFLDHGKSLGESYSQFKKDVDLSNKLAVDKSLQNDFENNLNRTYTKLALFAVRELKSSGIISLPQKHFQVLLSHWEPRQY